MSDSVLLGLNVTNHVSAHCNILARSALSRSAEAMSVILIYNYLKRFSKVPNFGPILLRPFSVTLATDKLK